MQGGHQTKPPQHGLSACQVAWEEVLEPCSRSHERWDSAGWGLLGHWGRQSPNMLSTAHGFIQKPSIKRTAGSRVDSGSLTEPQRRQDRSRHNPSGKYGHILEMVILCEIPLKTKQALGSDGEMSEPGPEVEVGVEGVEPRGSSFSTPAKTSFTVSFNPASTHSELTGSIAFSRGKEPAQYRGPFQLHISAQGTGQCPGINTHIAPEAADPHRHLKQPIIRARGMLIDAPPF